MIFYSTLQFFGWGNFRKACRSPKKESKQSEITCKQSETDRTISKIEKRREFVRALYHQQRPNHSFKRLYIVKELLVFVKKASFSEEFRSEFECGGEGQEVRKKERKVSHHDPLHRIEFGPSKLFSQTFKFP